MQRPRGAVLQPPGRGGGPMGGLPGGGFGGPIGGLPGGGFGGPGGLDRPGGSGLFLRASSERCFACSAICWPTSRLCPGGPEARSLPFAPGSPGLPDLSDLSVSLAGGLAGCVGFGSGILRTISSGTFASGSTMTRIVTSRSSLLRAGGVCAYTTEVMRTATSSSRAARMMPSLLMQCHPVLTRAPVRLMIVAVPRRAWPRSLAVSGRRARFPPRRVHHRECARSPATRGDSRPA
jgi:hypothetical protein